MLLPLTLHYLPTRAVLEPAVAIGHGPCQLKQNLLFFCTHRGLLHLP